VDEPELELDLLVEAMGPRWVWARGQLIEQRRLISKRERERAGLICGSFGKWGDNKGDREFCELGGGSIE